MVAAASTTATSSSTSATTSTVTTATTSTEGATGGGLASWLGEAQVNVRDQNLALLLALARLCDRVLAHLDKVSRLFHLEDLGVLPLGVVGTSIGSAGLRKRELESLGSLLLEVIIQGLDSNLGLGGLGRRSSRLPGDLLSILLAFKRSGGSITQTVVLLLFTVNNASSRVAVKSTVTGTTASTANTTGTTGTMGARS